MTAMRSMKRDAVFITMIGLSLTLTIILGWTSEASAEIYLWSDAQGVVHMTDQWAHVPESMRSRVSVRESSVSSTSAPQLSSQTGPQTTIPEAFTSKQQPWHMSPDVAESARTSITRPSVTLYPSPCSTLLAWHRPLIHRPKQFFAPFPFDVQLDPFDRNFIWVGPNRVPKDSLRYPHISLDQQIQLRDRVRALEEQRSSFRKPLPPQSLRR
jgi:Domain of unknown function (DUF4124)